MSSGNNNNSQGAGGNSSNVVDPGKNLIVGLHLPQSSRKYNHYATQSKKVVQKSNLLTHDSRPFLAVVSRTVIV